MPCVLLALVAGLLVGPGVGSAGAATTARSIEGACPAAHVPLAGYKDIAGHLFEHEIHCVVAYGAVSGVTATTYAPPRTVSREQLASYLAGLLETAGETRPVNVPDAFSDDAGSTHEDNINWIAWLGIVQGHADGTYRPSVAVSRDQLTTFLNGTIRVVTGGALTSSVDHFSDDETNVHRSNINALATAGVVAGVGGNRFDPSGVLLRGAMAAFVARTIDVLVAGGLIDLPFGATTLLVSPTAATNPPWSTDTKPDAGARTYTVSLPLDVSRITIALFPAENVTTSGGKKLFGSNAVVPAGSGTSIETVNGDAKTAAAAGQGVTQVNRVEPVGGVVTFRVDSVVSRSVVPVAYVDTVSPAGQKLDLATGASSSSPKEALELVVVGGSVSWQPPAPATGQDVATGTVRSFSLADRFYSLDVDGDGEGDHKITWATSDTFRYTATSISASGTITRTQFESWLSVGDRVDPSAYQPGSMTHVITGDVPAAPTGVAATATGDGTVTVTFTKPSNPIAKVAASSYRLQRATVAGSTVGAYAEVASIAGDASITNVPPESATYSYRVVARSATGDAPPSAAVQVAVTTPTPATVGSSIFDTGSSGESGANSVLDKGDAITLTFDRPVTVSSSWWSVDVLDRDGTVGELSTTNATTSVSGSPQVLVITLTSSPTIQIAGSKPGVDTRGVTSNTADTGFLQVVEASGIGNASGDWNLPKSGLVETHKNSRTIRDGRDAGALTPDAPSGHLVPTVGTKAFEVGRDEVQTISPWDHTSGTFTLTFNGQTTPSLDFDASSAEIEAALEVLPNIDDVAVGGGPVNTSQVTVTFQGSLAATDVAQLTLNNVDLGGGSVVPTVATTVAGRAVNGIALGDTVTVFDTSGIELGAATAGSNGRRTVNLSTLSTTIDVGQTFYVVVTRPVLGTFPRSKTATVTAL